MDKLEAFKKELEELFNRHKLTIVAGLQLEADGTIKVGTTVAEIRDKEPNEKQDKEPETTSDTTETPKQADKGSQDASEGTDTQESKE